MKSAAFEIREKLATYPATEPSKSQKMLNEKPFSKAKRGGAQIGFAALRATTRAQA